MKKISISLIHILILAGAITCAGIIAAPQARAQSDDSETTPWWATNPKVAQAPPAPNVPVQAPQPIPAQNAVPDSVPPPEGGERLPGGPFIRSMPCHYGATICASCGKAELAACYANYCANDANSNCPPRPDSSGGAPAH